MGAQRWLGVGRAGGTEPEPGTRAADSALRHADAKLLVVFCSASLDLPVVLRQINERSGGVPLIGCSTSGEISSSGPGLRSVVVTALGGDGFSIGTPAAAPVSADLRAAGASVARCLAGIGSDAPLGIGVRHGWRRVGEPMLVTGSGGNRVHTLDGQPALDVHLGRVGAPAEAYTSHEELARLALVHPLGLGGRVGEEEIRFIAGGDFDDRSLACIAEVPQAALVRLVEGDVESVRLAGSAACTDAQTLVLLSVA